MLCPSFHSLKNETKHRDKEDVREVGMIEGEMDNTKQDWYLENLYLFKSQFQGLKMFYLALLLLNFTLTYSFTI